MSADTPRCPKCGTPVGSKGDYCNNCQLAKVREHGYIRDRT